MRSGPRSDRVSILRSRVDVIIKNTIEPHNLDLYPRPDYSTSRKIGSQRVDVIELAEAAAIVAW